MKQTKQEKELQLKQLIIAAALLLMIIVGTFVITILLLTKPQDPSPKISVASTLKEIVNVSELSTFTAVYNGIAEVKNEKKPEKIDYYVSYEAKVNAGVDFEKINIELDEESKHIYVLLPDAYITEISVTIESLDFMFINNKANSSSVTQEAFKACEEDVKKESSEQDAIYALAKQNAVNIITALIKPIVEQMDEGYQLIVE